MIHLLHGIHTEGLVGPVQALRPYLKRPCSYPDYGWIAAVETRRLNPVVIGALLPYVQEDDVLIGHSNGCAIAYQVAQKMPVRGLIFINGALKNDVVIPSWVKFVHVYYNEGDKITEVAEFEEGMPASPVDQLWGDMGHEGYKGGDLRVRNFNCGSTADMPACWGHSDIGTPEKIKAWGPFIANELEARLVFWDAAAV